MYSSTYNVYNMSIEKNAYNIGENKEITNDVPQISGLRKWFNNTIMAVMTVAASITGGAVISSTSGCTFDASGIVAPKDAGPDIDGDADADVDGDAEVPDEICNDGDDNDEDGLVDCADPDCDGQEGPGEGTCSIVEDCGDDYDNNGNGLTDCEETVTCEGFQDPRGFKCTASGGREETACDDNIDNDGDWAEDCDDPDCFGTPACTANPEICDNGVDDDGDTLIDCADANCEGEVGPGGGNCSIVEDCEDEYDNNGNGDVDCADIAGCFGHQNVQDGWECNGTGGKTEIDCADGDDNDGDGQTDCDDLDCDNDPACGESCDNGVDDDGDNLVDCEDPDCDNFSNGAITCAYGVEWETNCTNSVDDDGNGAPDCTDPICAVMPVCGGGVEICDDGLDNDGDGFIDCVDGACVLDPRCTVWTSIGSGTPGQLCNTWEPDPCHLGRTAQVTLTCPSINTTPADGCY